MSEQERAARRPAIPSDMKAFNRALIEDFRAHGGKLSGPMAGRILILLTTTGRLSGETRTVVLGFGRHGDELVAIASNNGAPDHPAWYKNLLANPTATIELGEEKFEVRARTAELAERDGYATLVPYLESQQKLTDREIPLVVFEKVKGANSAR